MEDQMICGALELLNDEAKEDALKGEDSSSTLSPINSEPGEFFIRNRAVVLVSIVKNLKLCCRTT
jgi:hypothetical protein